jgi:hypothetical protein
MEKIWTDGTTSGFGSQLEEIVTQGAMQGLPSKAMAARDCARAATLIFSKAPVCMYVCIYIYRNHPYFDGLYQPMYSKFGDGLLLTIAIITLSIIYKV